MPHETLKISGEAFIYFIRATGGGGPIKIGSSENPPSRLRFLLNWSPVDLEIVAAARGIRACEMVLKKRFDAQHIRNEWFEPTAEIVALMEFVKLHKALPDELVSAGRAHAQAREQAWRRPRRPMFGPGGIDYTDFIKRTAKTRAIGAKKRSETAKRKREERQQRRTVDFQLVTTQRPSA